MNPVTELQEKKWLCLWKWDKDCVHNNFVREGQVCGLWRTAGANILSVLGSGSIQQRVLNILWSDGRAPVSLFVNLSLNEALGSQVTQTRSRPCLQMVAHLNAACFLFRFISTVSPWQPRTAPSWLPWYPALRKRMTMKGKSLVIDGCL